MKSREVSDAEIALIKKFLRYEDGKVFWRENRGQRVKSGDMAGHIHHNGYRTIGLSGRTHLEHRVVWILVHGRAPHECLDHISGIRDDNRIENLREVSHEGNNRAYNKLMKGTTSRFRGVCWDKKAGKWRSQIKTNGKINYLGVFTCETEAARAYDKKAIELGFYEEALNFKTKNQ